MTLAAGVLGDVPGDWTDRNALRRVVCDLLAEQRSLATRRTLPAADILSWTDATRLDEDGIGFDSLALLESASRASEFFHLHEVGIEDYLLIRRTLGGWLDIVEESLRRTAARLTFRTSGSTGEPKRCRHDVAVLRQEVRHHAELLLSFGGRRIVSLVPAHHIYGFLFTVLLPAEARWPVVDGRTSILSLDRLAQPGDVIVATPFLWSLAAARTEHWPAGIIGVTSTAPMPSDLQRRLMQQGLPACVEIYGSSETAGIAVRTVPDAPFDLLPYWSKDDAGLRRHAIGDPPAGTIMPLADESVWAGLRALRPGGRKDGAVQVGGVNVYPVRIAEALARHPAVDTCHVALDGDAAQARLVALVVPRQNVPDLPEDLERFAAEHLSAPERPAAFRLIDALPRNAMGKVVAASAHA